MMEFWLLIFLFLRIFLRRFSVFFLFFCRSLCWFFLRAFLLPVSFFFFHLLSQRQYWLLVAAVSVAVAVVLHLLRLVICCFYFFYFVLLVSVVDFNQSPVLAWFSLICFIQDVLARTGTYTHPHKHGYMAKINYTLKLKFFRTNSDLLSLLLQPLSLFAYLGA